VVVVEGFGLEIEIGNEGRQWLGHQRGERRSRWRERRTIAGKKTKRRFVGGMRCVGGFYGFHEKGEWQQTC
jgi:hypothetical protein